MQPQGPQTPYEVFCPRCRVTFPVGTRSCIHCGGRLARDRWQPADKRVTFDEGAGPLEDERPRISPFSPVALIWVLLFVAGTIYRACTSGS
jgi:hypothetical protein